MLLNRPAPFDSVETVNDADGMIANFWRAVAAAPEEVARHADWPVNENDLHARHAWLVGQKDSLQARLEGDPEYFDPKIAGRWVWGCCCWIGSGWCGGKGPWQAVDMPDGTRQLVHLGNAGQGVNRQLVHLGDAGRGVNRQLVHLGDAGRGEPQARTEGIYLWMGELYARLRRVRVCCGDWSRVVGPTPTVKQGLTAVFLDPPYGKEDGRDLDLYRMDSGTLAADCRAWAIEHGDNPKLRIALCGYDGFSMPADWTPLRWKANGGYGSQGNGRGRDNTAREVVWFSPRSLRIAEAQATCPLFAATTP